MPNLVTYFVEGMRVYSPTPKVAERNPERFKTVAGTFYKTETSPKGIVTPTEVLSFVSKNIDIEDALAEGFSIDIPNGLLTLSEGTRGRQSFGSDTQEDILADLAALRGQADPEPDPEV